MFTNLINAWASSNCSVEWQENVSLFTTANYPSSNVSKDKQEIHQTSEWTYSVIRNPNEWLEQAGSSCTFYGIHCPTLTAQKVGLIFKGKQYRAQTDEEIKNLRSYKISHFSINQQKHHIEIQATIQAEPFDHHFLQQVIEDKKDSCITTQFIALAILNKVKKQDDITVHFVLAK